MAARSQQLLAAILILGLFAGTLITLAITGPSLTGAVIVFGATLAVTGALAASPRICSRKNRQSRK
jgi:hypothetical protein